MGEYTVSYREQEIAREHGVYFLFLGPQQNLRGFAPLVAAISYRTGAIILRDNEVYARSQLAKMGVKIVAECRAPDLNPAPAEASEFSAPSP